MSSPKAFVVLKPGSALTLDAPVAHCREHLAAYKVPRAIQFVDEVPITASGKILRRLLKEIDDGSDRESRPAERVGERGGGG